MLAHYCDGLYVPYRGSLSQGKAAKFATLYISFTLAPVAWK